MGGASHGSLCPVCTCPFDLITFYVFFISFWLFNLLYLTCVMVNKAVKKKKKKKLQETFGALHISLVSSDELEDEEDALATRPLTWRVEEVSDFFKTLDDRWKAAMTPQQKHKSVSQRNGLPKSTEPKWSSPAVSLGCMIFVDHSAIVLGAALL